MVHLVGRNLEISGSKSDKEPEAALATHNRAIQESNSLDMYTDKSEIRGKIEAAAIAPDRNITEKAYSR